MLNIDGIPEDLQKGCYICKNIKWDSGEDLYDSGYVYCDKRDDEPEEKFKTWPALRKLKCFDPILTPPTKEQ